MAGAVPEERLSIVLIVVFNGHFGVVAQCAWALRRKQLASREGPLHGFQLVVSLAGVVPVVPSAFCHGRLPVFTRARIIHEASQELRFLHFTIDVITVQRIWVIDFAASAHGCIGLFCPFGAGEMSRLAVAEQHPRSTLRRASGVHRWPARYCGRLDNSRRGGRGSRAYLCRLRPLQPFGCPLCQSIWHPRRLRLRRRSLCRHQPPVLIVRPRAVFQDGVDSGQVRYPGVQPRVQVLRLDGDNAAVMARSRDFRRGFVGDGCK
jgi:hypothetical protein